MQTLGTRNPFVTVCKTQHVEFDCGLSSPFSLDTLDLLEFELGGVGATNPIALTTCQYFRRTAGRTIINIIYFCGSVVAPHSQRSRVIFLITFAFSTFSLSTFASPRLSLGCDSSCGLSISAIQHPAVSFLCPASDVSHHPLCYSALTRRNATPMG